MNRAELIELARAYVALSNAHRLEFILPMFDKNAIYSSAYVGEFEGRESIAKMMASFFEGFPDVNWQVEAFQYQGDDTVGFEFVMTATNRQTDESIRRSAYEQIKFSEQGFIELLEVRQSR